MMDKILIHLLKRKIRNFINELNYNRYITATSTNTSLQYIKLENDNSEKISKNIMVLEEAIEIIKN